jgi:hypothetical protein
LYRGRCPRHTARSSGAEVAILGTILVAASLALALQAALVGIFGRLARQPSFSSDAEPEKPVYTGRSDFSEFFALYEGYERLQLFLARMVGVVAFVYGIVARNWYFIGLGGALMILFSIWNRMIARSSEPQEAETESDASTLN